MSKYTGTGDFLKSVAVLVALVVFVFVMAVLILMSSSQGLDRTITLYSCDGKPIQVWNTRTTVEDKGGTCYFLVDGKAVVISGTFSIVEK